MKTPALSLFLTIGLFVNANARADVPINFSCQPKGESHHEMPAEGAYLSGGVILLGNGAVSARIDHLSLAKNDGTILDYGKLLQNPEVSVAATYQVGEGATGIEMDIQKARGSSLPMPLKSVLLTLEGNWLENAIPAVVFGQVAIDKANGAKDQSDVICQLSN